MGELAEIKRLQDELDSFYDKKTSFREKGKIRVFYMIEYNGYYDSKKYGFEYESIGGKYGVVDVLNKILAFKPDIIITVNSTMIARQYYDHKHILYINDNDYTPDIFLLPYIEMQKNEIHLYYCKEYYELLGKLYGDDSIYSHILFKNFVTGSAFLKHQLEIPEEFDTDIVIVAGSNSSISRTKVYIEGCCSSWMKGSGNECIKEKVINVLYQMLDIFMDRMDETGELIEEENIYIEEFWKLMGEDREELQKISSVNQQYFIQLIRVLVGFGVYRRLIAKWITESGYKVELWGEAWENEPGMEKFYKGNVYDQEVLAKIYNRSKVCLYTNPDLGMHLSIFEMIGSKSLCMAYRNVNVAQSLLQDSFKDGESIVFYKNRQELLDKLDFYINNMDERASIINNGYQIINEQNLYWEYELTQAVEKAVEYAKENMNMK